MSVADWDEHDVALAASVFGGAPGRAAAIQRLEAWLTGRGLPQPRVASIELSVGAAVEVDLSDGSKAFAKVWSPTIDPAALAAQLRMQDALARRGFPAPALRSGLERMGEAWAVLMDFDRSGEPTDVRKPGVTEAMGAGLARLVTAAASLPEASGLPRHELPELWPRPHSVLFDFEATTAGAEWIDEAARQARAVLGGGAAVGVPGHLDWSAKNMRMRGLQIAVVYDWDALHLAEECFIVGSAAASFPTTWELPVDPVPSPEQIDLFVAAYERERGAPFNRDQRARIAAGIAYSHAYTARCDYAVDPDGARERWSGVLAREAARLRP